MSLFVEFQQLFLGFSLYNGLLDPLADGLQRYEFAECRLDQEGHLVPALAVLVNLFNFG